MEFASPDSVEEALYLLGRYGPDARLLAGGQSLMILLRQRLLSPRLIVGLKRVRELVGVERANGSLRLRAMTTYRDVAAHEAVRSELPALARAADSVGSVHIRNLGTVGGSVCHGDPAGDVPTVLLAHDASLESVSADGPSSQRLDGFFTGTSQHAACGGTATGARRRVSQVTPSAWAGTLIPSMTEARADSISP